MRTEHYRVSSIVVTTRGVGLIHPNVPCCSAGKLITDVVRNGSLEFSVILEILFGVVLMMKSMLMYALLWY